MRRFTLCALALSLAGCPSPSPPADAALADAAFADAGDDAGSDAGRDASRDAGLDARGIPDGGDAVDPHWGEREACVFSAGAQPEDTLGDLGPLRAAITHVIILVQENRSFDHMYGTLGHGTEGIPSGYTNPRDGAPVAPYHLTTPCVADIGHQWVEMHLGWNHGAMDGWAGINGVGALGYYEDADHPFYTWMLTTFATSDRYFSSVLSGTYPNRDYLYAGTSDGVYATGGGYPDVPTVFDQLDAAGIAWGEYNASPTEVLSGTLGWALDHVGVHPYAELFPALADGSLPPVAFVDVEPHDEHPPGSIHDGERDVRDVVTAAMQSPLWPHLAFFYTYDEGGGFFDHVPPPSACLAAPSEHDFDVLGVRVPVAVVSPYARAGYVSHLTHHHSSILRFVQAVFDLPALTGRDANADAMLDLFDFGAPAFATPPATVPDAAPAGCGG